MRVSSSFSYQRKLAVEGDQNCAACGMQMGFADTCSHFHENDPVEPQSFGWIVLRRAGPQFEPVQQRSERFYDDA
ncbi:hypothetical protein Y032_0178g696 [Ancylostoma ceylanicum]|uniref:Uncharacterized protein n=1 Tax=Ancylostoma ceylanicum TaxID=53326 RepID=A0A016SU68_9BILA|nr:hypothetical protein Y032_0178g696 [Ancylostoma ceylanicum]